MASKRTPTDDGKSIDGRPVEDTPINATARVIAVQEDIVTIESIGESSAMQPLVKNEVVYICPNTPERSSGRLEKLKAEVLRVKGHTADAQVYESTAGVGVGDAVEQSGAMLSVNLGPGLLGQVYDGLQNPLADIAREFGNFLPRGAEEAALNQTNKWRFTPSAEVGDKLHAGDTLGTVQEGRFPHKIMVPFQIRGEVEVVWIQGGSFTVDTQIARVVDRDNKEHQLTMVQQWPVRSPLAGRMLQQGTSERLYPCEPMTTTQRLIDTFFPIAKGGMGCIPGPFGAGKTVLQHTISRYANVDIVLVVACGERAGEVVETITEFPKLSDPTGDGSLMDRTIIICNTSSMPVAAREASIYTGITLGEYYRQMGYNVLLIADSTSRWAQAMRETSGRLEEIPGEEAFPAYLDSSIKSVYERAGLMRTNDQSKGSLTMIGTVSPAGGNFEEPVTQSTLSTVKCFLGLSAERAYKRFYPAVDPLMSWSRYRQQLSSWYDENIEPGWTLRVDEMQDLLHRGDAVFQMMQVTGEEGVSMEDFVTFQKSLFLDMVYLQQDAFDSVDASAPLSRQKSSFKTIYQLTTRDYYFVDKNAARDYFTRLTGLFKNYNYAASDSPEHDKYLKEIAALAAKVPQSAQPDASDEPPEETDAA
jgi:V/A-type H+-transporting ATPase subunit A